VYITVRFMAKILKVESLQVTPNITGSFVDNDFFIIQKNGQSDILKIAKSGILPTLPTTGILGDADFLVVGDSTTNSLKKITKSDIVIGTDLKEMWLRN